MKNDLIKLIEELDQSIFNFLLPIQTTKEINEITFASLNELVEKLAEKLQNQDMVPKSALKNIYITIQILQREAPYFKASPSNRLIEMAQTLQNTFDLILFGETKNQRKPGVPRII